MKENTEIIDLISHVKLTVKRVNSWIKNKTNIESNNSSSDNIIMNTCFGDIDITTSKSPELVTPQSDRIFRDRNNDTNIHLVLGEDEKYSFWIMTFFGDITIKNLAASSLCITNTEGDITLENCVVEELKIDASENNIKLENVVVGNLQLDIADSNLQLNNLLLQDGDISSEDGDLKIKNIGVSNWLEIATDCGKISGKNIAAKTLTVVSVNGDIDLKRTIFDVSSIYSTNGDVRVKTKEDCCTDNIYSDTGDVKVKYFKK